jgi:hypothetical protein
MGLWARVRQAEEIRHVAHGLEAVRIVLHAEEVPHVRIEAAVDGQVISSLITQVALADKVRAVAGELELLRQQRQLERQEV